MALLLHRPPVATRPAHTHPRTPVHLLRPALVAAPACTMHQQRAAEWPSLSSGEASSDDFWLGPSPRAPAPAPPSAVASASPPKPRAAVMASEPRQHTARAQGLAQIMVPFAPDAEGARPQAAPDDVVSAAYARFDVPSALGPSYAGSSLHRNSTARHEPAPAPAQQRGCVMW